MKRLLVIGLLIACTPPPQPSAPAKRTLPIRTGPNLTQPVVRGTMHLDNLPVADGTVIVATITGQPDQRCTAVNKRCDIPLYVDSKNLFYCLRRETDPPCQISEALLTIEVPVQGGRRRIVGR